MSTRTIFPARGRETPGPASTGENRYSWAAASNAACSLLRWTLWRIAMKVANEAQVTTITTTVMMSRRRIPFAEGSRAGGAPTGGGRRGEAGADAGVLGGRRIGRAAGLGGDSAGSGSSWKP